jgi:serine/threonine-protein kinase
MRPDAKLWRRIDRLFANALELDGTAREQYLDDACRGDEALRREVESMLRFARASEDFLETPALAEMTAAFASSPAERHAPGAIDQARFIPGDIVAGRYRIVGLLGRGGMGEVYRADDLKLHQPVALKFLAESLATDGAALARFHREVSLARQVSHRHVCRVYDIGEHAGMHFLSMEYVRGEELASLIKRVGRLPLEKAIGTARQLCAGLAAIHATGVVHRDLKPANVMIDEHGDVRITDFGVAALAGKAHGSAIGTPGYMAPELLAGGAATARTDIYALGLVLYEAFTGKRPFAASTPDEAIRAPLTDSPPPPPSEWVSEIDARTERVILRCLEKDPQRRPASALQVAAALPGGDPLAAALAAGETPSPQMVAAATTTSTLQPVRATLLLASVLAGLVIVALLSRRASLHHFVPLERSPELLRAAAADFAREVGYTSRPADTAFSFTFDPKIVEYIARNDVRRDRWDRLRTAPLPVIQFWYRTAPRPLEPYSNWRVDAHDPPNDSPGMVRMHFDTSGRLLSFDARPPRIDSPRTTDWSRFFERAGLSLSRFHPATPLAMPPHPSDARFAWTGTHPQRPDLPLRIEAASFRGAPVFFQIVWPWTQESSPPWASTATPFVALLLAVYFGAIAFAALLAWKNLRLGRGDRRGAARLMLVVFASRLVFWFFMAHHVFAVGEIALVFAALQSAVYWAVLLGLLYVALEPFTRRRWPEALISWSRLLAGDVRDPLVGRDILIGGAFGLATIASLALFAVVPPLLGRAMPRPALNSTLLYEHGLAGAGGFFPLLANQTFASIMFPLILTNVALFFGMITRRNRVGLASLWVLVYAAVNLNFGDGSALSFVTALILPTILVFVLTRFGLLALVATFFYMHLWPFYPVTIDVTAWYATTYVMQLALLVGVAIFAFRTVEAR